MTLGELIDSGKLSRDTVVLGELWRTDDGAIMAKGGVAYCVYSRNESDPPDEWRVSPCRVGSNPEDPDPWIQVDDCECDSVHIFSKWMNRETAEAAMRHDAERIIES